MFTVSHLTTSILGTEEGSKWRVFLLSAGAWKPLTNIYTQSFRFTVSTFSTFWCYVQSLNMGILKSFRVLFKVSFVDFPKSGGM